MTAAAMVPFLVQRLSYSQSSKINGTASVVRVARYLIKVPKVTQSDWVVTATYLPSATADTIIGVIGYTVDSSSNATTETMTYTHTGDKLVMGSATVGTDFLIVDVLE